MIMKYKPAYRKIAMGLLSYTPDLKEVKTLQETIDQYENEESMKLFMYKKDDDIVGVLGYQETENGDIILHHICVNPSYRDEGIGEEMLFTMQERLGKKFTPSEETRTFLEKHQNN
ncbi:GNAT family N-acetyltransferase [Natribacillus halophilus]|uniref:Riboflavin biosynthesis RibT protein n=1 Tax=Natribacillus halophilus TaxID=549003 RepID=A0A1G8JFW5_9BACI|nr:GNAT family N-acetyltransferase [Natribacillus halophilus]SDI30148.1 riboflavin biosynthesis RibT protein [Natribacillus halophilus]